VRRVDPDELVGVTLPISGRVSMPVAYETWLDDANLVDEFDRWWSDRRAEVVHGDAFTPFAERHFAPLEVQECLRRLLG